jgi:hypothetical protein
MVLLGSKAPKDFIEVYQTRTGGAIQCDVKDYVTWLQNSLKINSGLRGGILPVRG